MIAQALALEGNRVGCKCGAHRLHRVFRYYWDHPSASSREAARALKTSEGNVRAALFRLRKRNLSRLCPECMNESLLRRVCRKCGFEPDTPDIQIEVRLSDQSPTNNLHPGNELGTEVDYRGQGFVNHWLVLKRKMDRGIEDPLIRAVKSDVENELKRTFPDESITDEAGRLAIKEVVEFRTRYPEMAKSKKARKQLATRVIDRIVFLHPHLKTVTALPKAQS